MRYLVILVLLLLVACNTGNGSAKPVERTVYEPGSNSAERIATTTKALSVQGGLPTPLADAYLREERLGSGDLGPSDYRTFIVLSVAPEQIAAWKGLITPLASTASYAAPSEARSWWVDEPTFATLKFYEPGALTGRVNGWIGVSESTGRIYIYTFTT